MKHTDLTELQKDYTQMLEFTLKDIFSSFNTKIVPEQYTGLTPAEIQILNFVRQGKSSSQIADILNLSTKTIEYHRLNIRKKLGISKGTNLRVYLLSFDEI